MRWKCKEMKIDLIFQEKRKGALSRSVDVDHIERGVENCIESVNVSNRLHTRTHFTC